MDKYFSMKESEKRAILTTKKAIEPKYLMGTTALAITGNISSDEYDLFRAFYETDEFWVGSWVTGFGFFDVLFPKTTSRNLTESEIEKYNSLTVKVASQPSVKLKVS